MSPTVTFLRVTVAGCSLELAGDSLRLRGPREALTPDLLAALRENKPVLLAHLEAPAENPLPPVAAVDLAELLDEHLGGCSVCTRGALHANQAGDLCPAGQILHQHSLEVRRSESETSDREDGQEAAPEPTVEAPTAAQGAPGHPAAGEDPEPERRAPAARKARRRAKASAGQAVGDEPGEVIRERAGSPPSQTREAGPGVPASASAPLGEATEAEQPAQATTKVKRAPRRKRVSFEVVDLYLDDLCPACRDLLRHHRKPVKRVRPMDEDERQMLLDLGPKPRAQIEWEMEQKAEYHRYTPW